MQLAQKLADLFSNPQSEVKENTIKNAMEQILFRSPISI